MKRYLLLLTLIFVFSCVYAQLPVKRVYIANDDHTDYMWTGNEAQYDSTFVHMLDYYLRQIDSTQYKPVNFQSRFNCDGGIWIKIYKKYRSPAQYNTLIQRIKSGHISVPLNFVVSTYGAQPTEAVFRGIYYSGRLERENNIRFPLAVCMENQTLPFGLSSLWAGSGAKYSWRGVCACATRIASGLSNREHQLYHYAGADNRSVIMKWYNRAPGSVAMGGYAEARTEKKIKDSFKDIGSIIPGLTTMCDTVSSNAAYPYNAVAAFGYGWDDLATFTPAFTQVAEAFTTPATSIRVSNEIDFFKDIEQHYKNLPTLSVTHGNEWDLYCASMNETTAKVRRATEKLRTAESLATLVSLEDSTFLEKLTDQREKAWDGFGFYWEHDWTADGPVSRQDRANWQIKQQNAICSYVDTLFNKSVLALGKQIPVSPLQQRFYVYNSLNWSRTDVADFEYAGDKAIKVINLVTGKEAASQLIIKSGRQHIRMLAENVPGVGYMVFEIQAGRGQKLSLAASFANGVLKNKYYQIKLANTGVITSILDIKASNRELIKQTNGRFLNDLGSLNSNSGKVIIENSGPVSVTIKAMSIDPVPHTVKITLYRDIHRIDVEDSITANFDKEKTWAFSFNLNKPTSHFEELGSILTAKKQSRGGSYANTNARYDWQTFNHFANLSDKEYNVTISNQDCSFFKLGQSTPDSLHENSNQLNALAGGNIDENMGIFKQNGETKFQYQFSLWPHTGSFNAVASMKFSLEHQNPLIAAGVTGKAGSHGYPEKLYSFISVNDQGVVLWALKPSEEGIKNGVIARFWNLNATPIRNLEINPSVPILKAWQTSHIETNQGVLVPKKGQFGLGFEANQINTYRLMIK